MNHRTPATTIACPTRRVVIARLAGGTISLTTNRFRVDVPKR